MNRRALALVFVSAALFTTACSGARPDDTTHTSTPTTEATATDAAALAAVEGLEKVYDEVSADVSVRDGSTKVTEARTAVTTAMAAVRAALQELIAQNRESKSDCGALYAKRQSVGGNVAAVTSAVEQSRSAQGALSAAIDQYAAKVAALQAQTSAAGTAVSGLSANAAPVVRLQTVSTSVNALNGVVTAARQSVAAAAAADAEATAGADQQYDSAKTIYQQCLNRAAKIEALKEAQKRN